MIFLRRGVAGLSKLWLCILCTELWTKTTTVLLKLQPTQSPHFTLALSLRRKQKLNLKRKHSLVLTLNSKISHAFRLTKEELRVRQRRYHGTLTGPVTHMVPRSCITHLITHRIPCCFIAILRTLVYWGICRFPTLFFTQCKFLNQNVARKPLRVSLPKL